MESIDRFFHLSERGTTWSTELLAGLTTFISMAYILFVNPVVLGAAGMDKGAIFTATGVIAVLATLLLGLWSNYPFAIAPGLGLNAFFTYSVVISMGVTWQTALAGVFIAGILFTLIATTKLRDLVIEAIPADLKAAIAAGVGLFITFLALKGSGVIVGNKDTLVSLASFSDPKVLWTIAGILITLILYANRVPAAIFIGMMITAFIGIVTGLVAVPDAVVSGLPSVHPTFGQALSHLGEINSLQMVAVVLTFLLVAFFDSAGTIVGLAKQGDYIDKDGTVPHVGRIFASNGLGMMFGAVLGTSSTTTYVESSAGIAVGGKTGLSSVFTSMFFFIALFFSPMLSVVTSQATAPALVVVGVLMASNLADINWRDFPIAASSLLIALGMPLTYSISDGIALGFIAYAILMLATRRYKEVNWMMYALAVIFIVFLWVTRAS